MTKENSKENNTLKTTLLILVGILVVSGALLTFGNPSLQFEQDWSELLQGRLALMMAVAVLIERSVEIYLNSIGNNGNSQRPKHRVAGDNSQVLAAKASLLLGLIAAFAGVRLMDVFGQPSADEYIIMFVIKTSWYGIDVVISGGLLAGGATVFHEVINILLAGLKRTNQFIGNKQESSDARPEKLEVTADRYYTIIVTRLTEDSGTLVFSDGAVNIRTTCWWEAGKNIAAKSYTNCSKTIMATKGHKSVYIKGATTPGSSEEDIFIHEGNSPSASDGCIVITQVEMLRLYNAIEPSNGHNVTVQVVDA